MSALEAYCSVETKIFQLSLNNTEGSLSRADTQECYESESTRPVQFSELVMDVPAETSAFCLSLLWTLKNQGLVQNWRWEEGVLRVWADTDQIVSRSSVPDCCGGNVWLLRLIEATQYREESQVQIQSNNSFESNDVGTDFSFLGCDFSHPLLQSA
mmetsp:Transcript_23603/g.49385  ORF Transcript_23603/g.49385 Transcript_23603/m.49385 type:complete len:156 (-) Transcript_23603:56-523(-)|eukprot:CAMPEP_0172152240 /NCGR_PEP_ID=MMETSP1050-20130122/723_1 /TAXON_ID=233186 /ORGANISM="Cryptomonas curvata, Strain CCAP979/52" /LENGTH=155 /DNA_ID=CAMNT_0012820531 /DNA_START=61 /DNA_END=528 /DNA_ORIENTATION=-